jgi:hypothetical protein
MRARPGRLMRCRRVSSEAEGEPGVGVRQRYALSGASHDVVVDRIGRQGSGCARGGWYVAVS